MATPQEDLNKRLVDQPLSGNELTRQASDLCDSVITEARQQSGFVFTAWRWNPVTREGEVITVESSERSDLLMRTRVEDPAEFERHGIDVSSFD